MFRTLYTEHHSSYTTLFLLQPLENPSNFHKLAFSWTLYKWWTSRIPPELPAHFSNSRERKAAYKDSKKRRTIYGAIKKYGIAQGWWDCILYERLKEIPIMDKGSWVGKKLLIPCFVVRMRNPSVNYSLFFICTFRQMRCHGIRLDGQMCRNSQWTTVHCRIDTFSVYHEGPSWLAYTRLNTAAAGQTKNHVFIGNLSGKSAKICFHWWLFI